MGTLSLMFLVTQWHDLYPLLLLSFLYRSIWFREHVSMIVVVKCLNLRLIVPFCVFSGSSGALINVVSNLFKLERATNFHLFQYRVDYNPEVLSRPIRMSMLKEHQDLIGSIYQFDGMMLFLPIRLEKEVCM